MKFDVLYDHAAITQEGINEVKMQYSESIFILSSTLKSYSNILYDRN